MVPLLRAAAPAPLSLPDAGSLFGVTVGLLFFLAVGVLAMWFNFALLSSAFSGGDDKPTAGKVNCAACGARTTTEPAECDYCGARLEGIEGAPT